ncbi:developmental regulator VelB [Stagonosporopsis vannaccii]|nr:developmental regulator VelB [Stagonosporopsis vannaccii]
MQSQIMYRDLPPGDQNGDYIGQHGGKSYRLRVDQQPIRARMCGFGDKDRRPITPPPCIRLIVCDAATGQEIDCNDIDTTFNVLVVDLWHEDISRGACNLVRHSSAAPTVSISSSVTTSFPPPPDRPMFLPQVQYNAYGQPIPAPHPYSQPQYYGGQPASGYPASYGAGYGAPAIPTQSSSSNHTRNLIGQASVNAFKLNDPEGKPGFWFVLQDLSVRTEGTFRLKFMIFNVGSGENANSILAHGEKTPMLASCFSDPFTVYSAKKFPGVIESTTLSKCFAQQGIKIPIRKDGPRTMANQSEYDNDD